MCYPLEGSSFAQWQQALLGRVRTIVLSSALASEPPGQTVANLGPDSSERTK